MAAHRQRDGRLHTHGWWAVEGMVQYSTMGSYKATGGDEIARFHGSATLA